MSTVSKTIADDIIAGKYPEDQAVKIVKYTNAWGGEAYGVVSAGGNLDNYRASNLVQNLSVYWEAPR